MNEPLANLMSPKVLLLFELLDFGGRVRQFLIAWTPPGCRFAGRAVFASSMWVVAFVRAAELPCATQLIVLLRCRS